MDDQLKTALRRLRSMPEFRTYLEHLVDRKRRVSEFGMKTDHNPSMYRAQGAFAELEELLLEADDALKETRKGPRTGQKFPT